MNIRLKNYNIRTINRLVGCEKTTPVCDIHIEFEQTEDDIKLNLNDIDNRDVATKEMLLDALNKLQNAIKEK